MANTEHVNILKKGSLTWNKWRESNPKINPDLSDINFVTEFPNKMEAYNLTRFENCNFKNCNLRRVSFRNGTYINCNFEGSFIQFSDLVDTIFESCSFNDVGMRVCKIGSAIFENCTFNNSDLSYSSAEDTSFTGSSFKEAKLENMSFINSNFTKTILEKCYVYGISSWDLLTENSVQSNLIITKEDQSTITVDNLELAQFIYMLINNKRLRDIIDTVTTKVVLILGNFSPEKKKVLDDLRNALRKHDYIPVLFDFDKPSSRTLTETVFTLAHISKFVIADLSSPRSIPHEVSTIIPRLPSVNFHPIIIETETEYGMFGDLEIYPRVKPIKKYSENNHLGVLLDIIEEENT